MTLVPGNEVVYKCDLHVPFRVKLVWSRIAVTTGDERSAGTDSAIHVVLKGESATTSRQPLSKSIDGNSNLFERAQVLLDIFF